MRYPVTGKVTFSGEPVPAGRVMFEPDSAAGNDGPPGVATITDGIYRTEPRFGAVGGPHLVRIDGHEKLDPAHPDVVRTLFQDFSTKVDLPRGPSTVDFDVPPKPNTGRARK